MSEGNYCLYPNQCGPGMDCSPCMESELSRRADTIQSLQQENDKFRRALAVEWVAPHTNGDGWIGCRNCGNYGYEKIAHAPACLLSTEGGD